MSSTFLRKLSAIELEEKILNAGVALCLIGMFLPWMSGRWLGDEIRYSSGFGSYTSFIGLTVFALQLYTLGITLLPLVSNRQLVSRRYKDHVRMYATAVSSILIVAALSVLLNITLDFQAMQIRFGVYVCCVGSLISSFYSYLLYHEKQRKETQAMFHHPEERVLEHIIEEKKQEHIYEQTTPTPSPVEPQLEEHPTHQQMQVRRNHSHSPTSRHER